MKGTSIAHYRIGAKLGEGGMGEVYRATDTRLGREVAVKLLTASLAGNRNMLARFEREAKVLATLNHPHIATIYGIETAAGAGAIVMELVEGETLEQRLSRGPMLVDECLEVFRQIAGALEAAHENGIIHRDLKPSNIKFTAHGQVKVLDFGLARLISNPVEIDEHEDTVLIETTLPGTVLGTPAYMSPEQTRGEPVDRRADVWAFGCCLYECMTGSRPFAGNTPSDMMAEVLKSDPDFGALPPETPGDLLALLRRCLQKELRRRLRDMGDIAIRLEEIRDAPRAMPSPAAAEQRIIRSVAILPFVNRNPAGELDFLADTLAHSSRNNLELSLAGIRFTSPRVDPSVFSPDSAQAQALGVDAFVQGTFFHHNNQLHINLVLIHGQEAKPLGKVVSHGSLDTIDVLELEGEVTREIARNFHIDSFGVGPGTPPPSDDVDPAAYRAWLEGMHAFEQATTDYAAAETYFRRAIAIDPGFAPPVAGLTFVQWQPTTFGGPVSLQDAVRATQPILDKHGSQVRHPEELALSQALIESVDYNWPHVERLYQQALHARYGQATARIYAAQFLAVVQARYAEGLALLDRVIEVEPLSALPLMFKSEALLLRGDYAPAVEILQSLADRRPGDWAVLSLLAKCRALHGEISKASADADEALSIASDHAYCRAIGAFVRACAGHHDAAAIEAAEMETHIADGTVRATWLAWVHLAAGDHGRALRLLESAPATLNPFGKGGILELRSRYLLEAFGEEPRYWAIADALKYPPLPLSHPYYETEMRLRFGR